MAPLQQLAAGLNHPEGARHRPGVGTHRWNSSSVSSSSAPRRKEGICRFTTSTASPTRFTVTLLWWESSGKEQVCLAPFKGVTRPRLHLPVPAHGALHGGGEIPAGRPSKVVVGHVDHQVEQAGLVAGQLSCAFPCHLSGHCPHGSAPQGLDRRQRRPPQGQVPEDRRGPAGDVRGHRRHRKEQTPSHQIE